ncbi:uncharacterized protein LOC116121206 [Pistacia vera]|uniref:uncharacterized protein LOC116121206 n=1 Tax=Pistacia vera TaxID=55513 RepID=UPI001263D595|nr:uncharacterized protein LOC116121206 [Pistacia vera]
MEPTSYLEAAQSKSWRSAMKEELAMIEKNQTWKLVDRPENRKVIRTENASIRAENQSLKEKAPRAWYSRINDHLLNLDFVRSPNEYTLYIREAEDDLMIISLYVDDLLVIGSNETQVDEFKKSMQSEFEMTDLGGMSYFLGMEIDQHVDGIFVNLRRYASEVLKKFCMENCKPVNLPLVPNLKLSKNEDGEKVDEGLYRSLIGCLLYLTATRPDLMYATSLLSRFMSNPTETHFKIAKSVLRYVTGSTDYGVWFKRSEDFSLIGYSDSDWAGSTDDMRSTSGFAFFMNHGAICWLSRKQETVAISTAEVEYISATAAVNQAI